MIPSDQISYTSCTYSVVWNLVYVVVISKVKKQKPWDSRDLRLGTSPLHYPIAGIVFSYPDRAHSPFNSNDTGWTLQFRGNAGTSGWSDFKESNETRSWMKALPSPHSFCQPQGGSPVEKQEGWTSRFHIHLWLQNQEPIASTLSLRATVSSSEKKLAILFVLLVLYGCYRSVKGYVTAIPKQNFQVHDLAPSFHLPWHISHLFFL